MCWAKLGLTSGSHIFLIKPFLQVEKGFICEMNLLNIQPPKKLSFPAFGQRHFLLIAHNNCIVTFYKTQHLVHINNKGMVHPDEAVVFFAELCLKLFERFGGKDAFRRVKINVSIVRS